MPRFVTKEEKDERRAKVLNYDFGVTMTKSRKELIDEIKRRYAGYPINNGEQVITVANLSEIIDLIEPSIEAKYARPKDHEIAQTVNKLTEIANTFHDFGCLREKISVEVLKLLK